MIPRLVIGGRYLVPDSSGTEVEGVLEDATVAETEGLAYGVYRLPDGQRIIAACPLEDAEMREYRRDPDNFFGVHKPVPRQITNFEEAFRFLHNTYRNTPKEKLLEFMSDQPEQQFAHLRKLSQAALARIYCEGIAVQLMQDSKSKLN